MAARITRMAAQFNRMLSLRGMPVDWGRRMRSVALSDTETFFMSLLGGAEGLGTLARYQGNFCVFDVRYSSYRLKGLRLCPSEIACQSGMTYSRAFFVHIASALTNRKWITKAVRLTNIHTCTWDKVHRFHCMSFNACIPLATDSQITQPKYHLFLISYKLA